LFKIRLSLPLKNVYRLNRDIDNSKKNFTSEESLLKGKDSLMDSEVKKIKSLFYRKGFEEGKKEAEASIIPLKKMFKQAIEELRVKKKNFLEESEKELVEMALAIAKKIIRKEVSVDRQVVREIAREALRRIADSPSQKIVVRINPKDWESIAQIDKEFFLPELSGSEVIIEKDESIGSGGCVVETENQMVDASIERQIEEIGRALMEEEKR